MNWLSKMFGGLSIAVLVAGCGEDPYLCNKSQEEFINENATKLVDTGRTVTALLPMFAEKAVIVIPRTRKVYDSVNRSPEEIDALVIQRNTACSKQNP